MTALVISSAASRLIVTSEIGSEQYYDDTEMHPTWPGGASGVTIGIGDDLGYTTAEAFRQDWAALAPADLDQLAYAVGKIGADAKDVLASVAYISIPYSVALAVYEMTRIPQTITLTSLTFPNCAFLSPNSFGALVSLVFNRGSDCSNTPNRREMYQIHGMMTDKAFPAIPDQIRSMTRLWEKSGPAGLVTRRMAEAQLFQDGLAPARPAPAAPVPGTPGEIMARGSKGGMVTKLQLALIGLHHLAPPPDGVFGVETEMAVEAFQTATGLVPDGVAGPLTQKALHLID